GPLVAGPRPGAGRGAPPLAPSGGGSPAPPLVLVCVDRSSNTLPALQASGGFTVNFLAGGREHLAVLYASKAEEKFDGISWRRPDIQEGGPILHEDSAAYAVCVTRQAIEAGDHWVFIGEVCDGAVIEGRLPLVYHQRAFIGLTGTGGSPGRRCTG